MSPPSTTIFKTHQQPNNYPQETFKHTTLHDHSLLSRRRKAVTTKTLLYQLSVLQKTGRYTAFDLNWHASYSDPPDVWPIPNHLFWDSDVAKWIEGACYLLHSSPTTTATTNDDDDNGEEGENGDLSKTDREKVVSAIEELVSKIRNAQQPDGYINIHYTVVEPGKRFTNLRDMHELYNAGHLIEAALAHHDYFNNRELLDPMVRYVGLLCDTFGDGEGMIRGYPGHPEVELALLRLYARVGDKRVLRLVEWFVGARGRVEFGDGDGDGDGDGVNGDEKMNGNKRNGKNFYTLEAEKRGEDPDKKPAYWPDKKDCFWYYLAHQPIVEMETIEGHSVRGMYLLTAVVDLILQDPESLSKTTDTEGLLSATRRLWRNMTERKMYVTGGIGAMKKWEGFGIDWFLPQGTDEGGCYSETCAAIGVMMLAERLLQVELQGEIADIMELSLYNAVLTAMSHDGTAFTYVNQLASSDQDLSKREEWFTCACCPPNILRILGQIGGYASTHIVDEVQKSAQIDIHLFLASTLKFAVRGEEVELVQETNWPWDGKVMFRLKTEVSDMKIKIRIPGWAKDWTISPQPSSSPTLEKGYLTLSPEYLRRNSSFILDIKLTPRKISPHPYTNQNTITLARGPIVYCVEDVDNPWVDDHFKSLQIDSHCTIDENPVKDETTGDEYVALSVTNGASLLDIENLKASPGIETEVIGNVKDGSKRIEKLNFIPYYLRANRGGKGMMRVGLKI